MDYYKEDMTKMTKSLSYEEYLKIKNKQDSDEERWLYGEYLATFKKVSLKN